MTRLKLSDVRVHVLQPGGLWLWLPIDFSPFYRCLIVKTGQGRAIVDRYLELIDHFLSPKRKEAERSYIQHLRLVVSIKRNGFEPSHHMEIKDGRAYDGQHRLAALLFLHGPNSELYLDEETGRAMAFSPAELRL